MGESSCRRTISLTGVADVAEPCRHCSNAPVPSHRRLIRQEDLEILHLLGEGAFGKVYKAEWRGLVVAAKFLKPRETDGELTEEQKHKLEAEAARTELKCNKHIAAFRGYSSDLNVILMEFYPNGSLYHFMHDPRNNRTVHDIDFRLRVLEEIAAAFVCLHHQEPCMIHRDLKPSNVFLDEHLRVKVGDLGLARMVDVLDNFSEVARTSDETRLMRLYQPPEVLNGTHLKDGYSIWSDVFSFGILSEEILTLKLPYHLPSDAPEDVMNAKILVVMKAVQNGELRPTIEEGCPKIPGRWDQSLEALIKLIASCCNETPDQRPEFDRIYAEIRRIRLQYNKNISAQDESLAVITPQTVVDIPDSDEDPFPCLKWNRTKGVLAVTGGCLLLILIMVGLFGHSLHLDERMSPTRICAWLIVSVLMLSKALYIIHCTWKCRRKQSAGWDGHQGSSGSNEQAIELTERLNDVEAQNDEWGKQPAIAPRPMESKIRQDAPFYASPEIAAAYPIPQELPKFLADISEELKSCNCPDACSVRKLSAQYIKDGMPDTNGWLRLVNSVISSVPALETSAWKWYEETYNIKELKAIDPGTNPDPFSAGPSTLACIPQLSNSPFPSQEGFFEDTDSERAIRHLGSRLDWSDTQSACSENDCVT